MMDAIAISMAMLVQVALDRQHRIQVAAGLQQDQAHFLEAEAQLQDGVVQLAP